MEPSRSDVPGSPDPRRQAPSGYDPDFLGIPVPLPTAPGRPARLLASTHFSVLMDVERRLAAVTAVNIDGTALLNLDRSGIDWELDDRLPADQQAGPELYRNNDLDRGHLVRRRDPVWGTPAVAARANAETFRYPNAAPQAADFNQGKELWLGLEDYLLAAADARRMSVFTGPVLDAADPVYRGVRVPLRFYKIAVVAVAGSSAFGNLSCAGYLLDQSTLVDLRDPGSVGTRADGPLGAYRTFQVPVADLAVLTGLQLGDLPALDVLAPVPVPAGVGEVRPDRWRELTGPQDLVLPAG